MINDWHIGNWYLTVRCKNCGVEFAFQPDMESGAETYFTDSGEMVLTCPDCRYPLPYSAEQIKRVQAK